MGEKERICKRYECFLTRRSIGAIIKLPFEGFQERTDFFMLTNNKKTALYSIFALVVLTVINCVLAFTEADVYFLFSASIPYFTLLFCTVLGAFSEMPIFFIGGAVIAVAFLLGLLLLGIFAKKHKWCFLAAGIMMVLDTVVLIILILAHLVTAPLFDILFHAWILFDLFRAYFEKPQTLAQEIVAVIDAEEPAEADVE